MDKWRNKVAIVTGASAGIGKGISLKLVSNGLTVVGCGRNFENLLALSNEISEDSRHRFIPFQCDIGKEEDVLKLFEYVKVNYGQLHVLINNAGFSLQGSILHGRTEDWKSMFETNVLGVCMCTREAFSMMKENEKSFNDVHEVPGHIINVNSLAGHQVVPVSFTHFYSSTKFALTAITESTRQELREAKSKIRVTQISPGFVETESHIKSGGESFLQLLKQAIPEPLQPEDIADAVVFILSMEPRSSIHEVKIRPTVSDM